MGTYGINLDKYYLVWHEYSAMSTTTYSLRMEPSATKPKRHFALCDSCYWSVTILEQGSLESCPVCPEKTKLSLIPLTSDETYCIAFNSKGIEMSFDKAR